MSKSRAGGYRCSDGLCSSASYSGGSLSIEFRPSSGGGSSYSGGSGYERVSSGKSSHDSSGGYVGHGGADCSIAEIKKANSVVNAALDDSGWGNQINALFAVLFDNVRFECSADNIKMREQINNLNNASDKNRVQLKKMAGILIQKENKKELKSEREKLVLDWLTRQYGYPSYQNPPGYNLQKQDDTGIYYIYSPSSGIRNNLNFFVTNGYIKLDDTHIKLDWSNELRKYNELLKPQPHYIYRVGGLTFFNEQSAKEYVSATRHARPCDVNRSDGQFIM